MKNSWNAFEISWRTSERPSPFASYYLVCFHKKAAYDLFRILSKNDLLFDVKIKHGTINIKEIKKFEDITEMFKNLIGGI